MRVRTWWMAGLALLGTAVASSGAPRDPACSTARLLGVRAPLFVLATAGTDTVRAGPGSHRYTPEAADSARLARIHGQRFRLDRVGGDVPPELAGTEGGEAVLVPYGSQCRETWPWREARWARPGEQVFADASLRPQAQWVDGIPTFDVEMIHDVYPQAWARWMVDDAVVADSLSAAQLFDLQQLLPTFEEVEAGAYPAYRRLLAWARDNPALASRFPADLVLAEANDALQPCVPAYDPHPVAGTYRATVIVQETDTLAMYFRTGASGYPLCSPAEPRLDLGAVQPRMADSTRLHLTGASTLSAIPQPGLYLSGRGDHCGGGSMEVRNTAIRRADGRRAWDADYNQLALPHCFAAHAGLARAVEATYAAYTARTLEDIPGRFHEAGDGEMRFEQVWRAEGRVMLRLLATRVSPQTLHLQ